MQLKEHGVNVLWHWPAMAPVLVLVSSVLWALDQIASLLHRSEAPSHPRLGNIPLAWAVGFNRVELFCDSCPCGLLLPYCGDLCQS